MTRREGEELVEEVGRGEAGLEGEEEVGEALADGDGEVADVGDGVEVEEEVDVVEVERGVEGGLGRGVGGTGREVWCWG